MPNRRFIIMVAVGLCSSPTFAADANWAVYLGDHSSSQSSSLQQINRRNVGDLELAWEYHSGDARDRGRSQIQCNPLIIDGVLYGVTPALKLVAVNAETGNELWRFDPLQHGSKGPASGVSRGVMHWRDGTDQRIFYAENNLLHAVNASSGLPVRSFGEDGRVDLRRDMGRNIQGLSVVVTTPGVIYGDLLIIGMRVAEGPGPAAPGPIRAYNIRTGELVWRFNTIPLPGEFGCDTWPPDAYKHIGGANVWTGFALDAERGLVFCPTGSAAFDFWGGNRLGDNLFANCLIALNAETGERVWHFQFVHHDIWDRDLPAPPNLVTVNHNGERIDAVAQATKSGHVFVFNRETGEPLFPIEEVPTPTSDLQGEAASPTQPLPTTPAPFTRQVFTYNEITDISPESHRQVLDRFTKIRPHTLFMPPSTEGTIIFPGFDGGAEWGGAATDLEGTLYVNANEMPWILTMVEMAKATDARVPNGRPLFAQICAPCHGMNLEGNAAQNIPSLVGVEERMKRSDAVTQLETGKGVMPSFAFLTDSQKQALVDYVFGNESSENDLSRQNSEPLAEALSVIPYSHTGYRRWQDTNGYPAIKPPWGTLNAIDLNTGEYKWRTTLGEFPELTARGVPPTGTENYGGPVVTAGGLIFIAASSDEHIRAFDKHTGEELWKAKLPAGGYATPATYSVGGRQYVVIACGGGKMGTPSGDAYVAFALPK